MRKEIIVYEGKVVKESWLEDWAIKIGEDKVLDIFSDYVDLNIKITIEVL